MILKDFFFHFKMFLKQLVHWLVREIVRPSRPFSSGSLQIWDATIGVTDLHLCYHSIYCPGVFWCTPKGTVILSPLFRISEKKLAEEAKGSKVRISILPSLTILPEYEDIMSLLLNYSIIETKVNWKFLSIIMSISEFSLFFNLT